MNATEISRQDASGIHLWLLLFKAFRAMQIHAERSIEGLGLCWSDFGVLEALLHKGPLPVKAIGEKVLLTSGSMTAAIDRLEERGLVARGSAPDDRRSTIVRLTDEGHKVTLKLFAAHERDMEQAVAGLSEEERAEAAEVLRKLGRTAEDTLRQQV